MKWNLRIGAWALNIQMSLQKVCILSLMRMDSNTYCLDKYWFTRQMDMPYWWRIKMWLYVGKVRNAKPPKVGTCVSNGIMGKQHCRGYWTSSNTISFRLHGNHLLRVSSTSLPSIGGWLMWLINNNQLSQPLTGLKLSRSFSFFLEQIVPRIFTICYGF